jgi:hypothetical protein
VSRPVRYPNHPGKSVAAFSKISDLPCNVDSPGAHNAGRFTALSFEFVAKPEEASNAVLELPAAIQSALEDFAGFAGSLVMVSDLEARLITVIVLWQGNEAKRSCSQSVRRVRALLAPYLDRCLRTQNRMAYFTTPQNTQPSSIDTDFITGDSISQEANVCVA